MTFFYDLFKRLDAVENNPQPTQLTERDMGNALKKVAKRVMDKVAPGDDELLKRLEKDTGGKRPNMYNKPEQPKESMSAKQKSFAALAEPRDKITFADKIAGAKKEVDEMLGDVAAEAMKQAIGGHGEPVEENWDDMMAAVKSRAGLPKTAGNTERGHKHDIRHTATGRMVTRRVDPEGISVGADSDETPAAGERRGRGRPAGSSKSTGAKGPSGKSKLMTREEIDEAIAALEACGYAVSPLEEKAVSKKQQKFMGMVHAAQKGEKPASKEVAKTARTMKKKDAEDFAATKHKGLPDKKKSEDKKKSKDMEESSTTSGSVATSSDDSSKGKKKSGGSAVVGKGIYDSLNRELENMISESMNINVSMSTDAHGGPQKSVTVTATDDDAAELASLLSMAGVNMGSETESHACASCGQAPCGCAEVVDENAADWPTEPEYQDTDYMTQQLAGGLNRPKTTGQTVGAPFNHQGQRQGVMKEDEDDECPVHGYYALPNQEDESGCTCNSGDHVDEVDLDRLSELAGLGKGMEEGNEFSGALAKAKQAGKQQFDVDGKTYDVTEGSMDEENEMSEADSLRARLGVNSVDKFARPGQTDFRDISAGNHPRSRNKYSDEYRSSQPDRLKREIKKSLGNHPTPNLPEGSDSHAGRLFRELQQFKG